MVDVPQFSKNERRFWLGGVSPHPFCSCTSKLFTFLGILQTFCAATCTSSYIRVQVVCTSFKLKQLVQCVSAARTSMASPICSTSHARGSRVMTFWAEKLRVWLWLCCSDVVHVPIAPECEACGKDTQARRRELAKIDKFKRHFIQCVAS